MIKPKLSRVLVIPDPTKEETEGGLALPEGSKKRPQMGTVFACGPGTAEEPMLLKKGDKVLFSAGSGQDITIDDVDYLMFNESQIIGTYE